MAWLDKRRRDDVRRHFYVHGWLTTGQRKAGDETSSLSRDGLDVIPLPSGSLLSCGLLFEGGPASIPKQIRTMLPDKFPKSDEVDPIRVNAGIGFNAPAQVRAFPRAQVIAS